MLLNPFRVHHGDCIGADAAMHIIARDYLNKVVVIHPPTDDAKRAFCKWDILLGAKPYLDRNHDIVDRSEVMIACPGEHNEVLRSGTWATIRYARKLKKPIIIIKPTTVELENMKRVIPSKGEVFRVRNDLLMHGISENTLRISSDERVICVDILRMSTLHEKYSYSKNVCDVAHRFKEHTPTYVFLSSDEELCFCILEPLAINLELISGDP